MYAELEASGVGGGATARAGVGASANAAAPAATSAARRDDTAGDDEPEGSTDAAKTAPARGRRVARGDARERARAANGVGTTRATRMLVCRSEDERVPDRIAELAADTISSLVSCGARFRCSAVSPTLTDPPRPPPPPRIFSARRDGQEQEWRPGVVRRRRLDRRRPHAHPRAVRGRARAVRGEGRRQGWRQVRHL